MIDTRHIHFKILKKLCCFCSDINTQLLLENIKQCIQYYTVGLWIDGKTLMDRRLDGWKRGGLTVCSITLRGSKWVSRIRTDPALCQSLFNLGQASFYHNHKTSYYRFINEALFIIT